MEDTHCRQLTEETAQVVTDSLLLRLFEATTANWTRARTLERVTRVLEILSDKFPKGLFDFSWPKDFSVVMEAQARAFSYPLWHADTNQLAAKIKAPTSTKPKDRPPFLQAMLAVAASSIIAESVDRTYILSKDDVLAEELTQFLDVFEKSQSMEKIHKAVDDSFPTKELSGLRGAINKAFHQLKVDGIAEKLAKIVNDNLLPLETMTDAVEKTSEGKAPQGD